MVSVRCKMKFLLHGGRSVARRKAFCRERAEWGEWDRGAKLPWPCLPFGLPVKLPFLAPFSPFPSHTHAQSTVPIPKTRRTWSRRSDWCCFTAIGTLVLRRTLHICFDFVAVLHIKQMTNEKCNTEGQGPRFRTIHK